TALGRKGRVSRRVGRQALFFFSSRRRHTRSKRDWSSDVCSSDLIRRDRGLLERARRILIACVTALAACRGDRGGNAALPVPGGGGGEPRVTVEVLNASGTPGLARVGTRMLRRAGIDVLTYGNAPETVGALDSTRIVVRRGTEEVGRRVRRALGLGRVVVQLDSARLLD